MPSLPYCTPQKVASIVEEYNKSHPIPGKDTRIPDATAADEGKVLGVNKAGEYAFVEGGSGGGVDEEKVHEIVAEDTADHVTQEELEEAISHATGKIELKVENIASAETSLNAWYELDLGEYTFDDFQDHKFILTYKGMVMEEAGDAYLERMGIVAPEYPETEDEYVGGFTFVGGDRLMLIDFYVTAKGTSIGYGLLMPAAASAVGDVNKVMNGYQDYDTGLWKQVGSAVLTNRDSIHNIIDQCGPDHAAISVTTLGEGFAETGIGLHDYNAETERTLSRRASVYASSDPFIEEVEGSIHHSIVLGTTFEGQRDGNTISGLACVAAQAKLLDGTDGERSVDDSSVILRAPNIALQTTNLTLQTLDPIGGALGKPSKFLFGKYNSVINGTSYSIKQVTLSNIAHASLLPWNNDAYPALLLLDEGEMVELTNVSATEQSLSGEMYDVKTGFHFHFSIPVGGRGEFIPNSSTSLFRLLKPFSAVVDDDFNYTHLHETCVSDRYKFTSDIQGLTNDAVYIAKDFSKIRISGNADFPSNQEYTVYAKEIGIDGEVPYAGQFWFLVPDANSSAGFVSHWVKLDAGAE